MKRIKLKKRYRFKFKNLFMLFLVTLILTLFISSLKLVRLFENNTDLISSIIHNTNSFQVNKSSYIPHVTNILFSSKPNNPISILESTFNYKMITDEENYDVNELSKIASHVKDPSPEKVKEPLVYIYNSHQLENYSKNNIEEYSVTPTVMTASYILRDDLRKLDIESIVEEQDISEFIRINNWNYNYSYLASRYYLNDAIEKNKSLKYFIDVHRDSIPRSASLITIDNKNYAKILFVIGLEHKNYNNNLNLATNFSNKVNGKYPGLSKGIMTKQGPNVNGIYNQDVNPNALLIEVGGYENTIEEVSNTMEAISQIIKEIIDEKEK